MVAWGRGVWYGRDILARGYTPIYRKSHAPVGRFLYGKITSLP